MKKRSLLTSIFASSVLAGTLILSGCGGSSDSSSDELASLQKGDTTAQGTVKIIADSSGAVNTTVSILSETKQVQVAEATILAVSNDGESCCTEASDNCSVSAVQISACGIDTSDAAFVTAKNNIQDLINGAGDRYDDNSSMVVFGGTLTVSGEGFDQATMSLAINMITCGSAVTPDGDAVEAGFANEGHIVDVLVEDADGNTTWIRDVRIKDGKILLTPDQIGSLSLPATFTFYSIKDSNKDNTTGLSGSTGAGGY